MLVKSTASCQRSVVGHVSCSHVSQGFCSRKGVDFTHRKSNRVLSDHMKYGSMWDCKEMYRGGSVVTLATKEEQETKAVLFDMDGVLCNSEVVSRKAGAETMKVLYGIDVSPDEFIKFTGTGEANFLSGVATKFGVENFDVESCKAKFFEIYLKKYAVPGAGIGYEGAKELVQACRDVGLKTAVASSADLIKVHANLSAADIPLDIFDAIVSADAFENLKPSPDIFLAAAAKLGIPPANCVVIEDAIAGVTAARAADMRCIGVTTTLSEEDMIASAPDKIAVTIKDINLETILTLKDTRDRYTQKIEPRLSYLEGVAGVYLGSEVMLLPKILLAMVSLATMIYFAASRDDFSMMVYRNQVLPWSIQLGLSLFVSIGLPYWKNSVLKYSSSASLRRFLSQDISYKRLDCFPWINSDPLILSDYRIVVLKFWTSGCINCQNTQSRIQRIWDSYGSKGVLVIGIHSAKFSQENNPSLVENSVKKLNITYPVVLDSEDNLLFKQFGVTGWPTFVAMEPLPDDGDARARILCTCIGENELNRLEDYLGDVCGSPDFKLETAEEPNTSHNYASPSYVDFDPLKDRIFMSDTGNNRIFILNSHGECLDTIGGTNAGYQDGSRPKFKAPRGLVYNASNDCVYVCDTGNHSIRCIDMKTKRVSTLCGNGNQGFDLIGGKGGMAQRLNAPYGIVMAPGGTSVLVSMAGIHQIWSIDIDTGLAFSFSGIGRELNRNRGLLGNGLSVAYSQPQGLAVQYPDKLVVTDSESSSIRLLNIKTGGAKSLIGGDLWFEGNLFLFGDRDGSANFGRFPLLRPLLEHPSDVAVCPDNPNQIYISDTYNNKIKLYDYEKNELRTVSDAFISPEGICFMDTSHLLVVDRSGLQVLNINDGQISNLLLTFQQDDSINICRID